MLISFFLLRKEVIHVDDSTTLQVTTAGILATQLFNRLAYFRHTYDIYLSCKIPNFEPQPQKAIKSANAIMMVLGCHIRFRNCYIDL